ncbi:metallophosphoesterase family protein [Agreia sp.]|uniref:metallophosphoesterase family protein n=1 Tax=Agreia sp. TaxID=1872416 RepID=UPI0035BC6B19
MSTRIVIMADTHLPRRAKKLPRALWAAIEGADVVLHAGDWVDELTLDELQHRSRRLVGVYGNNDGDGLRSRLPETARFDVEGVRFAMIHETGPAAGRDERMGRKFTGTDVLVFGHSHIPWNSTAAGGLRLLNPGSPTDRRRQPRCTYITAVADGGELRDIELHPVDRDPA